MLFLSAKRDKLRRATMVGSELAITDFSIDKELYTVGETVSSQIRVVQIGISEENDTIGLQLIGEDDGVYGQNSYTERIYSELELSLNVAIPEDYPFESTRVRVSAVSRHDGVPQIDDFREIRVNVTKEAVEHYYRSDYYRHKRLWKKKAQIVKEKLVTRKTFYDTVYGIVSHLKLTNAEALGWHEGIQLGDTVQIDFTLTDNGGIILRKDKRVAGKIYYTAYDREDNEIGKLKIWGNMDKWLELTDFWDVDEMYARILGGQV